MIKRLSYLCLLFGGLIVGLVLVRQPQLFEKRAAVAPSGSTLYFIHQDQLGSTALITDATGAAVSRLAYYPYGSTRSSEGNSPTQRQYTGQIADTEETGLYYYNARYYHPAIGKFTQADSAADGLNRYAYVGGNPVRFTDPTGHCIEGAEDYETCMAIVERIERNNSNVNVVICSGGEMESGCRGWTVREVEILESVLKDYLFKDYLDLNLNFMRTDAYNVPGNTSAVTHGERYNKAWISLSDKAWETSSDLGIFSPLVKALFVEDWQRFAGVIAHELTHVAMLNHPELLEWWKSASGNHGFKARDWRLSYLYNWPDPNKVHLASGLSYNDFAQSELFPLAVASMMYQPWWGINARYQPSNNLQIPFLSGGGSGVTNRYYAY